MKNRPCSYLLALCLAALMRPAVAESASFLFEVRPVEESPSVFWEEMRCEERAALWPLLTQEQRLNHWRLMSKEERHALRERIAPINRIRHQYTNGYGFGHEAGTQHHMNPEQRMKLREQIRAVYRELKHGVPFECSDPRNCPHEFIRIIDTHH